MIAQRRSLNLLLCLAVSVVLLIAMSLVSYRNVQSNRDDQLWVRHTREVIEQIDAVRLLLLNAESAKRAFMLTADDAFAEAHRASARLVPERLAELRAMVDDNPRQRQRFEDLDPVVATRLEFLGEAMDFRRTHGTEECIRWIADHGYATDVRQRIEGVFDLARREEADLLARRITESQASGRSVIAFIWWSALVAATILVAATLLIRRENAYRRRAEDERDRFFASALDLFCIAGLDGYFQRLNPAFTAVLGYSREELLAQPFISFVHPDDVAATLAEVEKLGKGVDTINFENRYRCKDGSWRWLLWTSTTDIERGVIYATARDISERKRMEQDLRDRQAETRAALEAERRANAESQAYSSALERSNRELRDFAHVASHDLQEPLRMISSFCALLKEQYQGKLDRDADEYIAHAIDGTKRLQTLIQDLLSYSRLEHKPGMFAAIDPAAALDEALLNLEASIAESGAVVERGPLPPLVGDHRHLVQLFQNLVGNAIKYRSAAPPRIRVEARALADGWELTVTDNGIGISPRHHQRIFGLFKRLHGRDRYPGTGIGLSICQKIAELHGGRIWVDSESGAGATFHVVLKGGSQSMPSHSTERITA
jgi:PAS domain S-box-containing protein